MANQYLKKTCGPAEVTMSRGNLKLDKSIGIFNLPAGKEYTCQKDCPGCYAKKAQKLYPTVLPCRLKNLEASKSSFFADVMVALVKQAKFDVVRFHESGDIYSQDYADKLAEIATRCPETRFYLYTKTEFRPVAPNLNIVESLLPDGNLNYGPLPYVKEKSKEFSIPVCPVTLKVKGSKCGRTCKLCQTRPRVLFVEH